VIGSNGGSYGYAIGDQEAEFVDNYDLAFAGEAAPTTLSTDPADNSIPAWAIALIVLGSIVLVALIVVQVQLGLLLRK